MEQVRNEQTIYSAAVYCRLSKDDEQAGENETGIKVRVAAVRSLR